MGTNMLLTLVCLLVIIVGAFYLAYKKKQEAEELYKLAYFDRLTGLGNKHRMLADLRQSLKKQPETPLTLVSLDIVSLKQLNQVMGYEYGTGIICSVSEEVMLRLSEGENCYRMGGDVFCIILVSHGQDEDWLRLEELLLGISMMYGETHRNSLHFAAGAYTVNPQLLELLGSSEEEKSKKLSDNVLEELWSNADLARKRGKRDGNTTLNFYTDELLDKLTEEQLLEDAMLPAMLNDEFVMYFQPKYSCQVDGAKLVGAEALVRWQHPGKGLMSPGSFIPLFEQDGKSPVLDEHIMNLVCRQLSEWQQQGYQLVPVSVNASRQTLLQGEKFLRDTEEALTKYKVPKKYVEIEVLESGSAENEGALVNFLHELRAHNFRIAMDDFGSGYSSLGALAHMPIDCLKLDKSFFDDWTPEMSAKDAGIVRSVINMAHDLGMVVVAEGVEEKYQVELLQSMGADIIQGFYFSKPLPAAEFVKRLTQAGQEDKKI